MHCLNIAIKVVLLRSKVQYSNASLKSPEDSVSSQSTLFKSMIITKAVLNCVAEANASRRRTYSGCSIRTLSREFEKKYGFGPKAFIKKCRLNPAYLELLSLDKEMATVTQVAFDYSDSSCL